MASSLLACCCCFCCCHAPFAAASQLQVAWLASLLLLPAAPLRLLLLLLASFKCGGVHRPPLLWLHWQTLHLLWLHFQTLNLQQEEQQTAPILQMLQLLQHGSRMRWRVLPQLLFQQQPPAHRAAMIQQMLGLRKARCVCCCGCCCCCSCCWGLVASLRTLLCGCVVRWLPCQLVCPAAEAAETCPPHAAAAAAVLVPIQG